MRKLKPTEALGLVFVAAGLLVYGWYASQRAGSSLDPEASAGDGGARRLAAQAPVVHMNLLAKEVEGYDSQGRDLFKYSQRPPTAEEIAAQREAAERARREAEEAEKRRIEAMAAAARERQEQQAHVAALAGAPAAPQPPPIHLKYIGNFGPKDDRIAAFMDGSDLVLARRGEVVQGKFKVVEIRYETVVMGFTDPQFRDRTRELPMATN